jgi:1-acyl-sn-glycerol-3-phosphate acyltransferase
MAAWTVGMTQSALWHLRMQGAVDRRPMRDRWVKSWAAGLLNVFGVQPTWHSLAPPSSRRPRLIVANHRSPIDILLMLEHFGGSVVARHDLDRWPVLGWAARSFDTIFVDRDDPRSGTRAIREIRRRLAAGLTVILFPEGTTYSGDEVREFQAGAFVAARGLRAELVPAGIAYELGSEFVGETFTEHMARMARRPVTRVAVSVGPPSETSTGHDATSLHMRAAVQRLVNQARRSLAPVPVSDSV